LARLPNFSLGFTWSMQRTIDAQHGINVGGWMISCRRHQIQNLRLLVLGQRATMLGMQVAKFEL